jgi:ATP-dependent Clp protease adaptor protein ClpS
MGFRESTKAREKHSVEIRYPDRFHVVVLNDDVTPMDFVIQLLVDIFNKTLSQAKDITIAVHTQGQAIAGSYSHEIAEQKQLEATGMAREQGFPLKITLEKM